MKPITKVFLVLGALVLGFIGYNIFFNDGGVIRTGWNWCANGINNAIINTFGTTEGPMPVWDDIEDVGYDSDEGGLLD